jgi:hypothetical protein
MLLKPELARLRAYNEIVRRVEGCVLIDFYIENAERKISPCAEPDSVVIKATLFFTKDLICFAFIDGLATGQTLILEHVLTIFLAGANRKQ